MKKLFFLLTLLPQLLFANTFRLGCATPTTTLYIWIEGEYLISQLRHPYGAKYTPFYKGSVSVFQIPELTKRADRQRSLTDYQEVQWRLDSCRISPPFKLSCREGKLIHPQDDSIRAVSLETSLITTEMVSGSFEGLHLSFGLNIEGDYHQVTSDFSLDRHCR
jgi:hypothetical protein